LLSRKSVSGISSPSARKHIILFSIVTFFFWASLYLYVPILPVYAQSTGASLTVVGTIVAAYAIPQMLFRIPIGILFDAINRRKFELCGCPGPRVGTRYLTSFLRPDSNRDWRRDLGYLCNLLRCLLSSRRRETCYWQNQFCAGYGPGNNHLLWGDNCGNEWLLLYLLWCGFTWDSGSNFPSGHQRAINTTD